MMMRAIAEQEGQQHAEIRLNLRHDLVQCAWGARKTPTFLGRTFRRLEVRIGKKL
jgi:hypothetical protein